MVWYGMVWYGMVWDGMVWYGRKSKQEGRVCSGRQVRHIVADRFPCCVLSYFLLVFVMEQVCSGRQVGHIVANAGIWCGINWHTGA